MLNPDGWLWIDRLAGGLSDTGKRLSAQAGGGTAQGDAEAHAVDTTMTCEGILLDLWRLSIQDGPMLGKLVGSPGFGPPLVTLRSHRCTGVNSAMLCLFLHGSAMLCLFLHRNAEFRSNLQKEDCLLSFVGDEEVRMVDNKELESGLKPMAEDFRLPGGGHKKLSRLVAGHMHWFDAAERRGMGWRDMIMALTAAGVNGRGGKPLSVGTLSSTVWRKRAETEDVMSRADRQARLAPPSPSQKANRFARERQVRSKEAVPRPLPASRPHSLRLYRRHPRRRSVGSRIGCRTLPVRSMKNSRAWRSYAAVRLGAGSQERYQQNTQNPSASRCAC
jgi:hypothetical protein